MATIADPRDIILAPVISEKSYGLIEDNVYTFIVHPDSNKTQIKIAIEKIFKVKVDLVNTQNRQGKRTRAGYGQQEHRRATTLAAGSKPIDLRLERRRSRQGDLRRMAIRKYKPTTPGRRGSSGSTLEITTSPEKSLVRPLHGKGGRARTRPHHHGRRARWPQAAYRAEHFRRHDKDGVQRRCAHRVRPQLAPRTSRCCTSTVRSATSSPPRVWKQGATAESAPTPDIKPGNNLPLRNIPAGTVIHAVELRPGGGAAFRPFGRCQHPAAQGEQPTPRCVCRPVRSVVSTCAAAPPSARWATPSRATSTWARPYACAGRASAPPSVCRVMNSGGPPARWW